MQTETKIIAHGKVDAKQQEMLIYNQQYLGYEVVNSTIQSEHLTVTYQRNTQLKHYYRLKDIEEKITKINALKDELRGEMITILEKKNTQLRTEHSVAKFFLWTLIFVDFYVVLNIISAIYGAPVDFVFLILWILIQVGLHVLIVYWFKFIKARSSDALHLYAIEQLNNQEKLLYSKASKISKE